MLPSHSTAGCDALELDEGVGHLAELVDLGVEVAGAAVSKFATAKKCLPPISNVPSQSTAGRDALELDEGVGRRAELVDLGVDVVAAVSVFATARKCCRRSRTLPSLSTMVATLGTHEGVGRRAELVDLGVDVVAARNSPRREVSAADPKCSQLRAPLVATLWNSTKESDVALNS